MKIRWDEKKSALLKANRGVSFDEAKAVLLDKANDLGGGLQGEDPEQYFAIGFASNGLLITLIYEYRSDDESDYIWLVTLWKTTNNEKKENGL